MNLKKLAIFKLGVKLRKGVQVGRSIAEVNCAI